MSLWICVRLSRLSLTVLHPSWPADAVAALEHDRACAVSPGGMALGVRPGMRRGSIMALAPQLRMLERQPAREQETRAGAALALLQYTPELAHAEEDSLLMNVQASLRLFGGPRGLCQRVHATLTTLGLPARLGMAPTAHGAWLLARSRRRALRMNRLHRQLDALPCAWLPSARPWQEWLDGLGCRTLADLRRLPRAGLQRRCGTELLRALDIAYGSVPALYEWVAPPAVFERKVELIARIDHAQAALFVAQRLIEELCGWLAARQSAVARLVLVLDHERGRHAMPPTEIELRLAEPAWQPDHLVRLLRERLARLELAAPIIQVGLRAPDPIAFAPPSDSLFPEPGGTPSDRKRLLELLSARLGTDRVRHPAARADHRPEVANHWLPIDQPADSQVPPHDLERPFWLLPAPIALITRDNRPLYGSPLHKVRGPERIESGWWDAPIARDYYVFEAQDATRYWLFQERNGTPGWYLHGIFG